MTTMAPCFLHYSIQSGVNMLYKSDQSFYTIGEVAVRLGMSSKRVSEMARHGDIPGIQRVEGSWVVAEEQLTSWLDAGSIRAVGAAANG